MKLRQLVFPFCVMLPAALRLLFWQGPRATVWVWGDWLLIGCGVFYVAQLWRHREVASG